MIFLHVLVVYNLNGSPKFSSSSLLLWLINNIFFGKMQVLLPQALLMEATAVAVVAMVAVDMEEVVMVAAVATAEAMGVVVEVVTAEVTVAAVVATIVAATAVGMAEVGIAVTPMIKILLQKVKPTKKKQILSLAVKTQVLTSKRMKTFLLKFLAVMPLNPSLLSKISNLVLLYYLMYADASTAGLPLSSVIPSQLAWLVVI
jgi:hypothetical protein